MKRSKQERKAFTLVEILVVVLIISLIGTVLIHRVYKEVGKTKKDIARAKMTNIESALGRFNLDCGRFPDDSEGLDALIVPPAELEEKWNGPYLKKSELLDPWENPYVYRSEGEINPGAFDLISFGADGQEGGEGDNADIYNE